MTILRLVWFLVFGLFPPAFSFVLGDRFSPISLLMDIVSLLLILTFLHFSQDQKPNPVMGWMARWCFLLATVFSLSAALNSVFLGGFCLESYDMGPIPGNYEPPPEPFGFLFYLFLPGLIVSWVFATGLFYRASFRAKLSTRSISIYWLSIFGLIPWISLLATICINFKHFYLIATHYDINNFIVIFTIGLLFQSILILLLIPFEIVRTMPNRTLPYECLMYGNLILVSLLHAIVIILMFGIQEFSCLEVYT